MSNLHPTASVVIAVGPTGARVLAGLAALLVGDPAARRACAGRLGFVQVFWETERKPDRGEGVESIDLPWEQVVVPQASGKGGSQGHPAAERAVPDLAGALRRVLAERVRLNREPEAAVPAWRAVDVWLVGALDDPAYRALLFPSAVVACHVVLGEFKALFGYRDPVHDAGFRLHPIGVSKNLSALSTDARREVVDLLARLEVWDRRGASTSTEPSGRRPPVIPCFTLIEGVGGGGEIPLGDLEHSVVALVALSLLTDDGAADGLGPWLDFPRGEQEDFVSSLALATLEFPVATFREYCVAHSVIRTTDRLLGQGGELQGQLGELFDALLRESEPDALKRSLLEDPSGTDLLAEVDQLTPSFVAYDAGPAPGPPGTRAVELERQGTFLPRVRGGEPALKLASFFGARWRAYPCDLLGCEGSGDPVGTLYRRIREIDDRGQRREGDLRVRLRDALACGLGQLADGCSLRGLTATLRKRVVTEMEARRERVAPQVDGSLPPAPSGRGFLAAAGELGLRIWQRAPLGRIVFWSVPLTVAFAAVYDLVLPSPREWAMNLFPALQGFYTDDPLSSDPVRALLPGMVQALAAGWTTVLLLSTVPLVRARGRIRALTRSALPLLARASRGPQGAAPGGAPTMGERRKVRRAERSEGLLAQQLRGMGDQFRSYWRARLERAADGWVYRTILGLGREAQDRLGRLEALESDLVGVRGRASERLRHMGEPHPGAPRLDEPPESYPESTFLDRKVLGPSALPKFYAHQHPGGAEPAALRWVEAIRDGRATDGRRLESLCEEIFPGLREEGGFALGLFADEFAEEEEAFLQALPDLLSPGEHLGYLAPAEADGRAPRTEIVVFGPGPVRHRLEAALTRIQNGARFGGACADPHRVYALRMIRSVEPATLARHLGLELKRVDEPPPQTPPPKVPRDASPWDGFDRGG